MTKKDFIALADVIKAQNKFTREPFTASQIEALVDFCREQNSRFNAERWRAYIAGECGPNGGTIRK